LTSWYEDEENENTPPHSTTPPGNTSLTFVIPVKQRPLMLLKTVLNLYGKAAHKANLFVRVVVYANDAATLSILPLLAAISPNIEVRINTRVELGYDQIEQLYTLGAEGIRTTLQAVYADRAHILTKGRTL
jgi:hypothetical protein